MQSVLNRPSRILLVSPTTALLLYCSTALLISTSPAHADIYQWEYINPADPSQGKQQSTTLAPDGAGVDAAPGAILGFRDLTQAYLTGANLAGAIVPNAKLTNADMSEANLTNAAFNGTTLTGADLRRARLSDAVLGGARLTDADFADTEVRGARFDLLYYDRVGFLYAGTGITLAQLYSTASYQARDLTGIGLSYTPLAGGNFTGQNLTNAKFDGATLSGADFSDANLANAHFSNTTLTGADFSGAQVRGADLGVSGFTLAQLYSTKSYADQDLTGLNVWGSDLTGANLAGQNLTNATISTVTDADFTGAEVRGAQIFGINLAQLYSTASYQAHDLTGIGLYDNNLIGGNFAGHNLAYAGFGGTNLTGASFREANLTNAVFHHIGIGDTGGSYVVLATLTDADLTAADARGTDLFTWVPENHRLAVFVGEGAISTNLIRTDGHIDGLDLDDGGLLLVRDYDGYPAYGRGPIPITVDQHLAMAPGGALRMVFEADAWDSTISFAPGIPVTLGGTLELTFAADVNLVSQLGRTFDVFDWTGVTPTGAFAVSSPYAWDLSNLYTTGQVTLTAIPEPSTFVIACLVIGTLVTFRRSKHVTRIHAALILLVACTGTAQADIYQWEYINPADPAQGKQQSTTLAPHGAGVDAVPGANLSNRNLTMAYLINTDLTGAYGYSTILINADLSQANLTNVRFQSAKLADAVFRDANLTNAYFAQAWLTGADFTGAEMRGVNVNDTGITLAQLYSTASYQAHDLSGISLEGNDLAGSNFAGQNLTNSSFYAATLTDADLTGALVQGARFRAGATGLTTTQLYSTASYQAHDLTGIGLHGDLTDWNFAGQNLANAIFSYATLTDADFTGALVQGAGFSPGATGLTTTQLYSTASYQAHDLTGITFGYGSDVTGWNFAGQNLANAVFSSVTLTDANFAGAWVARAHFDNFFGSGCYPCGEGYFIGTGIALAQLYSTASYQAGDLSGISLNGNDLTGGNFAGKNLANAGFWHATLTGAEFGQANLVTANFASTGLTGADFREANLSNAAFHYATLTAADFTDAEVRGASFYKGGSCTVECEPVGSGITLPQLYSTASYQVQELTGIDLGFNDLRGANFAGQNLTNADFYAANLTDADFAGADISGANFGIAYNSTGRPSGLRGTGITLAQLYSTASYQSKDLSGIRLDYNNLAGGNFAGQNLTNAFFYTATVEGADFTGADMRGVSNIGWFSATTANLISLGGHIIGLDLDAGGLLVVRDYDGNSNNPVYPYDPIPPIPITVSQHFAMAPGGTLRMVFETDAWDSTISFQPGIPVTLGGTLELTFAADVILASQIGRTLKIFDWTGVTPTGAFTISSPYRWNTSNLYTTGEVTLTAIPEPATAVLLFLAGAGASARLGHRCSKTRYV